MSSHINSYLEKLKSRGNIDMAESIADTARKFTKDQLDTFSFIDHEIGLLFGNVQAGKTAQMFGIICAAADASIPIFIVLTTDSVALQTQTYNRVVDDLSNCGFCICGEQDKQKFIDNRLQKPVIIILKKNSSVLLQWYNTLASSSFVRGNSLFIVDDEADAASPNTLVNQKRVSTINLRLSKIKNASIGSIYLQVTGTPQALLLQSSISEFRPAFTCYFPPGKGYLGGEFFFGDNKKPIFYIEDNENNSLRRALIQHLTASAQLFLSGSQVCNFVIHPGVRKASHDGAKRKVEKELALIEAFIDTPEFTNEVKAYWDNVMPEKSQKLAVEDILEEIKNILNNKKLKLIIMNGDTSIKDEDYKEGSNIIIGGNILGRGVTFPKLQTLYYTRTAKKPQADTMWQHSRMFGYDRDPGLMKVFITKTLYKLFSDINSANNSIISQVEKGIDKIQIFYPEGIAPTRKNVIDLKMVDLVAGGSNYYPDNPDNIDIARLDSILSGFDDKGYYPISIKVMRQILSQIIPSADFNLEAFNGVLNAITASKPNEQGILIVRRDRAVTQGTGSLISPNDGALGNQFEDKVVLTIYKIKGGMGWKQDGLWVPNIKLPDFINYYDVH